MEFNLADLFESVAGAIPERTAITCGRRRLTYAQLDDRANRLAHHLAGAGIGRSDHIGIQLCNGTEYVESMLAAFKLRAVPININYRYVEEELGYLFDDSDIVALIHQREFASRDSAVLPAVPRLRHLIAVEDGSGETLAAGSIEYEAALSSSHPARDFDARSADDRYILYTGGTTGLPKGVIWCHGDIFFAGTGGGRPLGEPVSHPHEVAENARALDPMTMMPVAPLMHGAAQLGVFITFWSGGKVVLCPRFDAAEIWRLVQAERINTLSIVGDAMARPLAEALAHDPSQYDTTSLLVISSAGAVFSEAIRRQLHQFLPHVALLESFGASETGFQGMGTESASPDHGLRFRMNVSTTVLDDELRSVEPGSDRVGHVALRGHVPLGYYKDELRTAAAFPVVDGIRYAILGDLARVDSDGTIVVLGRGSTCINSGGEKIFPEEVEAAVKAHPDVYDAVVVGVPDERWGQRVVTVVEPREGRRPTIEDIAAHCRSRIAGYKVPRELHLVDRMVRSPSGKPDYGWASGVATAALVH